MREWGVVLMETGGGERKGEERRGRRRKDCHYSHLCDISQNSTTGEIGKSVQNGIAVTHSGSLEGTAKKNKHLKLLLAGNTAGNMRECVSHNGKLKMLNK